MRKEEVFKEELMHQVLSDIKTGKLYILPSTNWRDADRKIRKYLVDEKGLDVSGSIIFAHVCMLNIKNNKIFSPLKADLATS